MEPPATPSAGALTGGAPTPPPCWAGRCRSGQPSPRPPSCFASSIWRCVRQRRPGFVLMGDPRQAQGRSRGHG
eukprot:9604861-Lingulodinium_polyedra.AAC.1